MKSWLAKYLEYTKEQESPELFHYWCGLSILSAVLGRGVYLRKYYNYKVKLYPNLFVILVAPSGRCKKGGALKFASDLMLEAGVKPFKGALTKRALTQALSDEIKIIDKKPQGESKIMIVSDELEVFLSKEGLLSGLFIALTDLFDCPDKWEYKTSSQGSDYLYNVYLGILGGTVPRWFSSLPTEVLSSGFFARIIIVAQQDTARKNSGVRKNEAVMEKQAKVEGDLLAYLNKLKEVKKELELSEQAIELYDGWYNEREVNQDDRYASFNEREHDHILKVAILLAASHGDLFLSNVISAARIKEALISLETIKNYMGLAYMGVGDSLTGKFADKIIRYVKEAGGKMEHSQLLKRMYYYLDGESFAKVMDTLCQMNKIRMEMVGKRRMYMIVKGGNGR